MKDLHSHILYGIDDGSKSLEESLVILKNAYKNGVTDIVLTPHYIKDSVYNTNKEKNQKLMDELKLKLKEIGVNLNLYLGNEVYIDEDIINLLRTNEISTINNSKYILIELPLNNESLILEEVIYELKKSGLVPIIAHPERYISYYNNFDFFSDLIDSGCLLQANIGSLYGKYGSKTKKMLKGLLKRDMIHFFGSDIHHKNSDIYEKNIQKDLLKILKDKKRVEDILMKNVDMVIKNQDINY